MGLVKAALGAASGVMGDQWKEYFYCSALPAEVLAVTHPCVLFWGYFSRPSFPETSSFSVDRMICIPGSVCVLTCHPM